MKKIEAIFKPLKLDEIKAALANERVERFSVFEVKGAGARQITIKQYRARVYSEDSNEVSVGILIDDEDVRSDRANL